MTLRWTTAALAGLLALAACGDGGQADRKAPAPPPGRAPAESGGAEEPVMMFLGTSLTAGYGLGAEYAYPALIQSKLDSAGLRYRVVNAGVSGETSAGALARIDWLLQEPPAVLVIETGANDGLRGIDPESMERNIQNIISHARKKRPDMRIFLVAMEAPPNLGPRYVRRFRQVYTDLAAENRVTLVPFLLNGVAGIDSLNQADGIHPTVRGQQIVAGNVWRALRPALERRDGTTSGG